MASDSPAIGRSMAKGAAWMVAMRLAIRLIGLVSTIILARLLVPADFGLVALATVFYAIIELASQFSFDVMLIKEQKADRSYYDTAWTLSILRGVGGAALLVAGAGLTADFFDDPRLESVVYVLALVAVAEGFVNVGIVDFRKELNFDREFRYLVSVKIAAFLVTIFLAFLLRSYWALVFGMFSGVIARLCLSYWMHPFRPRWSLAKWREIMNFSKWLLFTNFIGIFRDRGATFVVGKIGGAETLGLFLVAHEIATLATSELAAPIRRAVLPGYAKLAGDANRLKEVYLDGLSLTIMAALPIAAGIGLTADLLVPIFLGAKWLAAIPIIQILVIRGVLEVCLANTQPLVNAMGHPHLNTHVQSIAMVCEVPLLIFFTLEWGAHGAAAAVAVGAGTLVITYSIVLSRLIAVGWNDLLGAVWRSLFAVAVMTLAVFAVSETWVPSDAMPWLILKLAVEVAVGAVVYTATHLAVWRLCGSPTGAESYVLAALRSASTRLALAKSTG